MAIQIPNPGTGNGTTGDNEFAMWTKVGDNFNNQSHAASRLVGTANGQIPLAENIPRASQQEPIIKSAGVNFDLISDPIPGDVYLVNPSNANAPVTSSSLLLTANYSYLKSKKIIYAQSDNSPDRWVSINGSAFVPITTHRATYSTTTAAGANVVVDSSGKLMRSTSSERYKDIIADLELNDTAYDNAMQIAPIVYRSTADADNSNWHFYSFSAEALGEFDPAFVLWRHTETVTDDEGNVTEQLLDERQAEGININALLAFSHAVAIKQDKMIKALTERIGELESKLGE